MEANTNSEGASAISSNITKRQKKPARIEAKIRTSFKSLAETVTKNVTIQLIVSSRLSKKTSCSLDKLYISDY